VNAEWELVDIGSLSSKIEDSNLRVRHTSVESRLWVWLQMVSMRLDEGNKRKIPCSCSIGSNGLVVVPFLRSVYRNISKEVRTND